VFFFFFNYFILFFFIASGGQQLSYSHLFTSAEATAVIGRAFEQMCLTRLAMLRDLIIVQVLTLRLGERVRKLK
jgi:hypothetical protein